MALDYSKLSTAELEAIANDDFTKLSNRTLRALSNEPEPTALDKFKEPFKDVSVKDWAEKSFLAPMLQTMQSVTPFGMLRPDLARQNLQQGSQNLAGKVGQMAQGAYNVATNPVESAQKAYNAVTENPAGVAGELVKGALYDPEMLIGSGLGNLAEKGIKSAAPVVGGTVMAPYNVVKGGLRGVANPMGTAENTALLPIRPTYVPHPQVQEFMAGTRPASTLTEVPTAPLINESPITKWAYGMAPKNASGQKLVPSQGRFWEGVGENLGSGIRTNPLQGVIDIAGLATGYGPIASAIKSVPAMASGLLQRATQFEPNFGALRSAALQTEGRAGLEASIPKTPLLPAPAGPVSPTRTMYVNPEGVATTNVQGTQTNYKPGGRVTPNFATIRTQNQQAANQSRQMAAQKLQEIQAKQQPQQVLSPEQLQKGNDILDKIRTRNQQGGGTFTSKPATEGPFAQVETPVAGPVSPASVEASIDALPSDRFSLADKLALKRAELQKTPPTVMTAADEAAAQKEMAKQSNLTDWGKKTTADKDNARGILQSWFDNGGTIGGSATDPIYGKLIDLDDKGGLRDISTRLANQAADIQKKKGVDSIPAIPGFRDEEVIRMAHDMLAKTNKKPATYTPTETKSTASTKELLSKLNKQNNPPPNVSKEDWAKLNETGKVRPYDQTDPVGNIEQAIESTKRLIEKRDIKKKYGLETGPRDADLEQSIQKFENKLKDPIKLIQDELDNVKRDVAQRNSELASGGIPKGKSYGDLDGRLAKLEQRLSDAQKTSSSKTPPKNVSQMVMGNPKPTGALEKSLVTKRSFNGDLQKYRYGTEKSPLSFEEYNHLKNSEFIDKQNTRDILMGMRPDLTEYSIWYKDKSGKIQNIQTYGNEFKKK